MFKDTEFINGVLKYKKNVPKLHVIFGYLQIGSFYTHIENLNLPKELLYFPHAQKRFEGDKNNCIYVASKKLDFLDKPGAGCFKFDESLILTKNLGKRYSRSKWGLPKKDFHKVNISYHNQESWKDNYDYFQSAAIGQEFVIEENNKITEWAKKIIIAGTK